MAKKKNGNKIWITGAVLGAVAGAAYALWKTPMSGQELRSKLTNGPVERSDAVTSDTVRTPNAGDRLLSKVEQTLAPIVGVQLGKTANGPAPAYETVTAPISVPKTAPVTAAEAPVASQSQERTVMTKNDKRTETEKDPKFDAADADPDPGRNAPAYGAESIRAKRFAWGSPTPEAGVQPTPTEPMQEDPVTEPAMAREPAAPARVVPPGEGVYGRDSTDSQRYSWGEPTPDSTAEHDDDTGTDGDSKQPITDQLATAGAATAGESRPVEAVSGHAAVIKGSKRPFPTLGGLENN